MDGLLSNRAVTWWRIADIAEHLRRLKGQLTSIKLTEACPELMFASKCDLCIKGKMPLQRTTWRDKFIGRVCDRQRQFMPLEVDEELEEPADAVSTSIGPTAANTTRAD